MLINGGVVVCKFFLANVRQCFEMGGVIQGGMTVSLLKHHPNIAANNFFQICLFDFLHPSQHFPIHFGKGVQWVR